MSKEVNTKANSKSRVIKTGLFAAVIIVLLLICNPDVRRSFGEISLDNLPTGDAIGSYDSPDHRFTLTAYRCSGDLSDFAVRAALKNNQAQFSQPKNIYWQYHCSGAKVHWVNPNTVQINDKVLNVEHDTYDWRLH